MPNLHEYLEFAEQLARQAGAMMQGGMVTHTVTMKPDHSPVTEIDQKINDMVITEVTQTYPAHGVLGEEASHNTGASELWVCDPIDGTVAFLVHLPVSAFSIALVRDGKPVVAVIYNPWVDTMYTAIAGQGAHRNGRPMHVSTRGQHPGERILFAGKGANAYKGPFTSQSVRAQLAAKNWYTLHCLGLAYRGCLVAEGAMDATVYTHTGAHDVAALDLIVTEAGGKVTDLQGQTQRYDQPINGALISNGIVHNDLVEIAQLATRHRSQGAQRAHSGH